MHILFLTDNFPPEVNAPATRTFEHCREWVKAGHRVTVLTTAPNFPKGEVFAGYRNRIWHSESMAGIRVIRLWTYIAANAGFFRRTLDYVSFMVAAVLAAPFVRGVDIVVGTSPQLFTVCAARVVAALKRRPWVFELRDIWPESIKVVGAMKDGPILRLLERIEMDLYRSADRIVCVTNAFQRSIVARGVDAQKIAVVTNGADLSRFSPSPKPAALSASLDLSGKFVAGYVGTHGMAHALDTLLEAAALLKERSDAEAIRFLLLGDGAENARLVAYAKHKGLTNVVFVDTVAKDRVADYWALLDVSIIHLRKSALFETVIPSKLFECMAMGIPVLHGVRGESAAIVEREGVGELVEPQNAEALADAVLALARDEDRLAVYRAHALAAAPRYNRTALAGDMLLVLATAVEERASGSTRVSAI